MQRNIAIFMQQYSRWDQDPVSDKFTARTNTFDILELIDQLEPTVYADRDFKMANRMINNVT